MAALHPSRWTLWTEMFRRLYSSISCARRRRNERTLSLLDMWYIEADQPKAWLEFCIYGEGAERPLRRRLGLDGESGEEKARRNSCNEAPVLITSLIIPRERVAVRAHVWQSSMLSSTSQINRSSTNQISWVNLQLNFRTVLNHLLCIIQTIEFYLIY
jgi:hypothetical protein